MKLINSFHGATCLSHLLMTKVSLDKKESIELWINYNQTNSRVLGQTSKKS